MSDSKSINDQLSRFSNLKQKLESPELQQDMNENLDKLREQNRLVHSDILKDAIDKIELLIMDEDITNALGYKMYIEHLISLAQHLWKNKYLNLKLVSVIFEIMKCSRWLAFRIA